MNKTGKPINLAEMAKMAWGPGFWMLQQVRAERILSCEEKLLAERVEDIKINNKLPGLVLRFCCKNFAQTNAKISNALPALEQRRVEAQKSVGRLQNEISEYQQIIETFGDVQH
ncbi:MAG: hypothetical protein FWC61_00635 [Proteobacteria bacterium]|nr:hypothetical protein [Pseudomonadota bacterium]